jgi:uncharacterized protein YndB with AHSA1/START domain
MNSGSPFGEVQRDGGQTTLRFVRELAHAPEKVWRALTQSNHLRWWMPVDMIGERATGATVRLAFWPDVVERKGLDPDAGTATIQVWDPPSVFEWVWHGTRIRFELTATADGCRLQLLVEFDGDDPDTVVVNAAGYHLWMEHLATLLNTGSSAPIAEADAEPLEATYGAQLHQR